MVFETSLIQEFIFRVCREAIPHKKFSFAKIWLLSAQFEIRQLNLQGARLLLGTAIGMAPKDKVAQVFNWLFLSFSCYTMCFS